MIAAELVLPKDMNYKGNCYPVALFTASNLGLTVCHGQPLGLGGNARGLRYWHAWCETQDGLTVVDLSNGLRTEMSVPVYYALGNVDANAVRRYTVDEAFALIDESGHAGPWPEGADAWPR